MLTSLFFPSFAFLPFPFPFLLFPFPFPSLPFPSLPFPSLFLDPLPFSLSFPFILFPFLPSLLLLFRFLSPFLSLSLLFFFSLEVEVDESKHTFAKKIAEAQVAGYNYILVVGEKEANAVLTLFPFPLFSFLSV